ILPPEVSSILSHGVSVFGAGEGCCFGVFCASASGFWSVLGLVLVGRVVPLVLRKRHSPRPWWSLHRCRPSSRAPRAVSRFSHFLGFVERFSIDPQPKLFSDFEERHS